MTSDYYQATQYEDVVTVYDPVAGFGTGGGTFRIGILLTVDYLDGQTA